MSRHGSPPSATMFALTAVLLLFAVLFCACCGCISLEKDDDLDTVPATVESSCSGSPAPLGGETPASSSPLSVSGNRNIVVPVTPIPVQPGEPLPASNPCKVSSVSLSCEDDEIPVVERTKIFEERYSLTDSARGLQVDVDDVPFIITFSVDAQSSDPGAYSRLVVTVRDPESLRLIADEGYNGIYGSAREKSIKLYRSGRYIVTLDGQFVDVNVKMQTERTRAP